MNKFKRNVLPCYILFDLLSRKMNKRSEGKNFISANKPPRKNVGSKEALNASTEELKQMLAPKLDKIKKTQEKYLQRRKKILDVRTT